MRSLEAFRKRYFPKAWADQLAAEGRWQEWWEERAAQLRVSEEVPHE